MVPREEGPPRSLTLVAQALGGDDRDLVADPLVGLEVQSQSGVVPLNDDLGGLLDGFCANATHFGDSIAEVGGKVGCWERLRSRCR